MRVVIVGDVQQRAMRARIDQFDWSATALGPRTAWPFELEAAVQQILDSDFPKALAWGPELITIHNDAFLPILGNKPEALGRSFAAIWSEAWDEIGPIAAAALAGRSTFIENFPLIVMRGAMPEQAYFTFCYSPIRKRDGSIGGMLDTVVETTRTVEAQQGLALVNGELAHRLKNSLAIVQAIAQQTLRPGCDPAAFASFERRLEALGHAHGVLLQQDWITGSLFKATWDSLAASLDMARVSVAGTDIAIGSRTSMALTMMLHELATNAVKYGAMSNETGRIEVNWTMSGPDLEFSWRETGGPPVAPPTRTGFGSRLIRNGLGTASRSDSSFDPGGLYFRITVPVVELAR